MPQKNPGFLVFIGLPCGHDGNVLPKLQNGNIHHEIMSFRKSEA